MAQRAPAPSGIDLARAVRDLPQAEQDFTRAYGAWLRADEPHRDVLRVDLERAEKDVDAAQREVIRRQPRPYE